MISFKGVSGLAFLLAAIPLAILAGLAIGSNLVIETIAEDVRNAEVSGLTEVAEIRDDGVSIVAATDKLLSQLYRSTESHLSGLATGRIEKSKQALSESQAAGKAADEMAALFKKTLSKPEFETGANEDVRIAVRFLVHSSDSLSRYIDFLNESRARTIKVFEESGREAAVANYTFEEANRERVLTGLAERLVRTGNTVIDSVSDTVMATARAEAAEGAEFLSLVRNGVFAVILLVSLAVLAVTVMISNRRLAWPLRQTSEAMVRLSERDYDVSLPPARSDEIGDIVKTLGVFREALREQDAAAERERERLATRERRREAMEGMTRSFDRTVTGMLGELGSAAARMSSTADGMISTTTETTDRANTVTNAAAETARNVQTVAAAAEELSASLSEASDQVSSSNASAQKAVTKIEDASKRIGELHSAAQKIGDVITLISDIAEQTNLLALNATIESARAGEAGKGFAVVANEVKSLANQTATATEDIRRQIADMQTATKGTVSSIREIESMMTDLSAASNDVASVIEQQSQATNEIAKNIQEASIGTETVSQTAEAVDSAAGETGKAATEVQDVSRQLSEEAEKLSSEVRNFLVSIREEGAESEAA